MVERTAAGLIEDRELPWHPSFFEMLTAIAFEHFSTCHLDVAVLEVGMGGRLDATNVVEPRVSVITDIALDHQKYLGNTIAEIAREKAGIIRPGSPVVALPQTPEANDVIGAAILKMNARAVNAVPYMPPVTPASPEYLPVLEASESGSKREHTRLMSRYPLEVMGRQILIETPLLGRHQLRNLALAIAAAVELGRQGFHVSAESIAKGIRQTQWAGRFQVIPGSYNLTAIQQTLNQIYSARTRLEVTGAGVQGINLAVRPGVEIPGQIALEGTAPANFQITQLRVNLNTQDAFKLESGGTG